MLIPRLPDEAPQAWANRVRTIFTYLSLGHYLDQHVDEDPWEDEELKVARDLHARFSEYPEVRAYLATAKL